MLVSELLQAYDQRTDTGQWKSVQQVHLKWWHARLGAMPIEALTSAQVQEALAELEAAGREASTRGYYLRALRIACDWALRTGRLAVNPCAGVPLPKQREAPPRILTPAEEAALCTALGHPYAAWVQFAILTGLRKSEQFTLQWRNVDLSTGGVTLVTATTRTAAELPLSADALALLQALRQQARSIWVFPDQTNPRRAVDIHQFYTATWPAAVRRAGIPWVAWKDLRHTAGARLAALGKSADEIASFLRHADLKRAFVYRVQDPSRKPATSAHTKVENSEVPCAPNLQAAILRDRAAQPFTFGELAELFAAHHLKARASRSNFDRIYRQFWQPWKDRPAASLGKKELLAWFAGLSATPAHANKAHGFLRSLYNWAMRLDLIDEYNPARFIQRYRTASRERFLSEEELGRFFAGLDRLSPKHRAYFLLLLLTGARRSEARTLQWREIDWTARLWRKPRTKNKKPHVIPIPIQALDVLRALPCASTWVFEGTDGRPWSASSTEKAWGNFRRMISLPDVRLHDLRRSLASYLAMHGNNLSTIQKVLNHHSLAQTSIYARLEVAPVSQALQVQADRFFQLTMKEASHAVAHCAPVGSDPVGVFRSDPEGGRFTGGNDRESSSTNSALSAHALPE